jgi:hypothetical protein
MSKYHYERITFKKKHQGEELVKLADAIADVKFYSFRKTYAAIHALPVEARKDAMRLLRIAQEDRGKPMPELKELWKNVQLKRSVTGHFDLADNRPAAYMHPIQRLELSGRLIGITTWSERIRGNKIRVYYSATETGLKLKKIEIRDRASDYFKSLNVHIWQAVFHCEK